MRLRAIVFVPGVAAPDVVPWADECLAYCRRCGYEVVGLVTGSWSHAQATVAAGAAEVVVVARREHIPPDRVPRTEVVAEAAPLPGGARRTRLIRRRGPAGGG